MPGAAEVTITEFLADGWLRIKYANVLGYCIGRNIKYYRAPPPVVPEIVLDGQRVKVTLDYAQLQTQFASDSSFLKYHKILIVDDDDPANIVLTAGRYGHGIGMSQRGAQQMAKLGMSYKEILGFYYNGTVLTEGDSTSTEPLPVVTPQITPVPTPAPTGDIEPTPAPTVGGNVGIVTTNNLIAEVYAQPDINSTVVGYLPSELAVEVVQDRDDGWVQIRYLQLSGYILDDYLDFEGTKEDFDQTYPQ